MSEMQPMRVQLRRTKGWETPPNTVRVSRPGKWGNPFVVGTHETTGCGTFYACDTAREAVAKFKHHCADRGFAYPIDEIDELRGKNLACWCPLDQPCHADVLLDIANSTNESRDCAIAEAPAERGVNE